MRAFAEIGGGAAVLLLLTACAVSSQRSAPGWRHSMPAPPTEALRAQLQRVAISCVDEQAVVEAGSAPSGGGAAFGAMAGGLAGWEAFARSSGGGGSGGGDLIGLTIGTIIGCIWGAAESAAAEDAWKAAAPAVRAVEGVLTERGHRLDLQTRVIRLAGSHAQRYVQPTERGADAVLRIRLNSMSLTGDWRAAVQVRISVCCRLEDPAGKLLHSFGLAYQGPDDFLQNLGANGGGNTRSEVRRGVDWLAEAIVDHLFLVYEPGRNPEATP